MAAARDPRVNALATAIGNDVQALQQGKLDKTSVSAFALTLLDDTTAAAMRTTLGLGSTATWNSVPNDHVTNARLANMPTMTLKGNDAGTAGDPKDLTVAQVKAMLAITSTDISDVLSTAANDARYVNVTGDTMTGPLVVVDGGWPVTAKATNNTVTNVGYRVLDEADVEQLRLYWARSTGDVYLQTKNTDGTTWNTLQLGSNGLLRWMGHTIWHSGSDGHGSTLDADTLDGKHASDFVTVDPVDGAALSSRYYARQAAGGAGTGYTLQDSAGNVVGGIDWTAATDTVTVGGPGGRNLALRPDGVLAWDGYTVWHSGNDGIGSALDAGYLGGASYASYARRDTMNSFSANQFIGRMDAANPNADATPSVMLANTGLISVYGSAAPAGQFGRSNNGIVMGFYWGAGTPVTVGSISVTGTATAYNTSSDYRLKENVEPLDNAAEQVMLLKPSTFNFKSEPGVRVPGFLAHELAEVLPTAVTGQKDGTREDPVYDDEGNEVGTVTVPDYQGVDHSKLVPLLTAALQDALRRIAELENRIEELA